MNSFSKLKISLKFIKKKKIPQKLVHELFNKTFQGYVSVFRKSTRNSTPEVFYGFFVKVLLWILPRVSQEVSREVFQKFLLGFLQKFHCEFFSYSSRDSYKDIFKIVTWVLLKTSSEIPSGILSEMSAQILC